MVIANKYWFYLILFFLNLSPDLESKSFSYPSSSGRSSSSSHTSSSRSHSSYRSYYKPHSYNNQSNQATSCMDFFYIFLFIFILMIFIWLNYEYKKTTIKKNPKKGNKNHVYRDYENVAEWFDDIRSREFYEKAYLDKALAYLKPNATILDLGCGMGQPITQYLAAKDFFVTGVDGSKKLITLAQQRIPQAKFITGDMRSTHFDQKFDCIILWHSLFHLPKADQRAMFIILSNSIQQDGILLFTTGPKSDETWSDNGGILMYHASLSATEYKRLLNQYGFEVLLHVVEDKDCGDATVWMARFKKIEKITL